MPVTRLARNFRDFSGDFLEARARLNQNDSSKFEVRIKLWDEFGVLLYLTEFVEVFNLKKNDVGSNSELGAPGTTEPSHPRPPVSIVQALMKVLGL